MNECHALLNVNDEVFMGKHRPLCHACCTACVLQYCNVIKRQFGADKEVIAWAKENLTGYKRPKYVAFVSELPKSNVGKILRKDLRQLEESKK